MFASCPAASQDAPQRSVAQGWMVEQIGAVARRPGRGRGGIGVFGVDLLDVKVIAFGAAGEEIHGFVMGKEPAVSVRRRIGGEAIVLDGGASRREGLDEVSQRIRKRDDDVAP